VAAGGEGGSLWRASAIAREPVESSGEDAELKLFQSR
jgi:hypothetical protein